MNVTKVDLPKEDDNAFLWRQFIRLGDMMGDGMHHEADGKWIAKEYRQLARILIPDYAEKERARRKRKSDAANEQMFKLLSDARCSCGGMLKQSRSGSKVCYCIECGKRYKAGHKPK